MMIQGYGMANTHTKWNGLPCLTRLPTFSDPVIGIEILPKGVEAVNVAVMKEENWVKAYKNFIDKTFRQEQD